MRNTTELLRRVVRGEEVFPRLVIPYVAQFASRWAGISYKDFCTSGEKLVEAQLVCQREFAYDGIYVSTDAAVTAEVLGCDVYYPDDDVPTVSSHPLAGVPLDSLSDYEVAVPDPRTDGRLPELLRATRLIAKEHDGRMVIICPNDGPMTLAGHLRGTTQLMADFADSPETVQRMLDKLVDVSIAFSLAQVEAGATCVHLGDPLAGLLSPQLYRKVVFPIHKKFMDVLRATGCLITVHICGRITDHLQHIVDLGADIIDLDSMVPLKYARQFADRVCLKGNIDTSTFLQGSKASMQAQVAEAMREMRGYPRYILGSGCHVPRDTEPDNLRSFVECGREYGIK